MKKIAKDYWAINVHSWGTLYAIGTEAEAEEWRRHKSNWEQSVATKRLATEEEVKKEKFDKLSDLL